MDRRSFLRGVLALTAVAAAPALPSFANVPVIYGDGIRDDTEGLQALFDGQPFRVDSEDLIAYDGLLMGGWFITSDTIFIQRDGFIISDCHFTVRNWRGAAEAPMLHITSSDHIVNHSRFDRTMSATDGVPPGAPVSSMRWIEAV